MTSALIDYFSIDWTQWLEEFQQGFREWQGKHPKSRFRDPSKPWGLEDRKHLPEIRELSDRRQRNFDFKVVEFIPDRSKPQESYILSGTYEQIGFQIRQFWTMRQFLQGINIGKFLGYPITQHMRQAPVLRSHISLHLVAGKMWEGEIAFPRLYGKRKKPYTLWPGQVTIFDPDLRKFTYKTLRNVCGGSRGLSWGAYTARAFLAPKTRDNAPRSRDGKSDDRHKSNSQMVARGGSLKEARENLERFLSLSRGVLTAEIREGYEPLKKEDPRPEQYRIYPGWTLVQLPSKQTLSKALSRGDYEAIIQHKLNQKFWLFEEEKPFSSWEKQLKAAFNFNFDTGADLKFI